MKALVWKSYGNTDIYVVNDHNFESVKEIVFGIMYSCYEKEDINKVQDANFWGDLVETVRELSYGDDNFETFQIVNVIV